jgi:hypothetical protein
MPLAKLKPRRRPVGYFPMPVRVLLLASISVVACVYALVRYYTHPALPMFVPAPPSADAGELPAPDIEVVP